MKKKLLCLSAALITSTCFGWKGTQVKRIYNKSNHAAKITRAFKEDFWIGPNESKDLGNNYMGRIYAKDKNLDRFTLKTAGKTYYLYDHNWKIYKWNGHKLHDKGKNSTKCVNITIKSDGSLAFSNSSC